MNFKERIEEAQKKLDTLRGDIAEMLGTTAEIKVEPFPGALPPEGLVDASIVPDAHAGPAGVLDLLHATGEGFA